MKKILLVDDQPNFVKMVSLKLEKMGYEVISAENGQIGLEKAMERIPDLVVMDIMMPEMDGFTSVVEMKKDPALANVNVIFLSAKGQAEDLKRAQELGAIDFIAKPFSPRLLIEKIELLLGPGQGA